MQHSKAKTIYENIPALASELQNLALLANRLEQISTLCGFIGAENTVVCPIVTGRRHSTDFYSAVTDGGPPYPFFLPPVDPSPDGFLRKCFISPLAWSFVSHRVHISFLFAWSDVKEDPWSPPFVPP
jgi:hypothetical protein